MVEVRASSLAQVQDRMSLADASVAAVVCVRFQDDPIRRVPGGAKVLDLARDRSEGEAVESFERIESKDWKRSWERVCRNERGRQ